MDEAVNSPIAHDFSQNQKHATVTNGYFAPGREGYALTIEGNGYARCENPPVDLTKDFTVEFWLKSMRFAPYSPPQSVVFQFAFSDNSIKSFAHPTLLNKWEHWCFVRNGNNVIFYKDYKQIGTATFTAGNPVEWAVKQSGTDAATLTATLPILFSGNDSPYLQGEMDEVKIYDEAMSISDLIPKERRVLYWIDDLPFMNYQVYVSDSKGVVDGLKLKDRVEVDWADEHGMMVDLERPRFQQREIELDCWMPADSMTEFAMKVDRFLKLFVSKGLHRLKIEINENKPLVYEVYCPDGTAVKKKWRQVDMIGTFTLKMKEAFPIKRVLRFNQKPPVSNPPVLPFSPFPTGFRGVYLNFKCPTPLNIYWGDGTSQVDVLAEDYLLLSHIYPKDQKNYEIIIAGEVDHIQDFTTNAITIWNRL